MKLDDNCLGALRKDKELARGVLHELNSLLKTKHLKLVMSSKYNSYCNDPVCVVSTVHTKFISDTYTHEVCAGWQTLEHALFENDDQHMLFNMNITSDFDEYVVNSINELGLKSLDGCSSYEEMLVRLAVLKGSER